MNQEILVLPSTIEMVPVFACGGTCLTSDCNSRQCQGRDILIYDISLDDGGTCFVGMKRSK